MSEDDFESLLRWIERREPAYAEGLREHVAAARAEGYARAREQAASRYDGMAAHIRADAERAGGEKLRLERTEMAEWWESEARDIRAMQDERAGCLACQHDSHPGKVCGDGLSCLCVRSS